MNKNITSYVRLECGHTYRVLPKEEIKTSCFCSRCNKSIRTIGMPQQAGDVLRSTGRTTRMLEDAIISCGSEQKRIIVFGHTLKYANILRERMRCILGERGLDKFISEIRSNMLVYNGTRIDFCSAHNAEEKILGLDRKTKVFTDHYAYRILYV